jgi:excisionase family DNA binding protein
MNIVTVTEYAEKMRVTPTQVRAWLKDGRISGFRFGRHGHWRIDADKANPLSPTPTSDDADVRSASSASDAGVSSPRAAASGPGSSEPTTPYTAQDTPVADHPIRETPPLPLAAALRTTNAKGA